MQIPTCPACDEPGVLVGGEVIYPHRPDLYHKRFYACLRHDAYVGCHPGTTSPMGRMADAPTRAMKLQAHAAFDPLWKSGKMKRSEAYRWLAGRLGIHPKNCHMGSMSDDHLRRVVSICKEYKA